MTKPKTISSQDKWEEEFDELFTGELWVAKPEDETSDRKLLKSFIKKQRLQVREDTIKEVKEWATKQNHGIAKWEDSDGKFGRLDTINDLALFLASLSPNRRSK